jgi:hypothetical protein
VVQHMRWLPQDAPFNHSKCTVLQHQNCRALECGFKIY